MRNRGNVDCQIFSYRDNTVFCSYSCVLCKIQYAYKYFKTIKPTEIIHTSNVMHGKDIHNRSTQTSTLLFTINNEVETHA